MEYNQIFSIFKEKNMTLTAVIKAHEGIVYLFLLLFIVKSFLFLTGKTVPFQAIRAKTKVLDMILGALVLASGLYLLAVRANIETWVIIKLVVVLGAIPLAIVGFKKENKTLVGLATLAFVCVFIVMKFKLYS